MDSCLAALQASLASASCTLLHLAACIQHGAVFWWVAQTYSTNSHVRMQKPSQEIKFCGNILTTRGCTRTENSLCLHHKSHNFSRYLPCICALASLGSRQRMQKAVKHHRVGFGMNKGKKNVDSGCGFCFNGTILMKSLSLLIAPIVVDGFACKISSLELLANLFITSVHSTEAFVSMPFVVDMCTLWKCISWLVVMNWDSCKFPRNVPKVLMRTYLLNYSKFLFDWTVNTLFQANINQLHL